MKAYSEKELFILRRNAIENAGEQEYRQYFCGNLQRPQILDFIQTENLEIGISNYSRFTADTPHMHMTTADMIYLLQGEYYIKIIEQDKEIVLHEGDFASIPIQMSYASKAAAGTKVLFVKVCHGNDKVNVEVTPKLAEWLAKEV